MSLTLKFSHQGQDHGGTFSLCSKIQTVKSCMSALAYIRFLQLYMCIHLIIIYTMNIVTLE